MRGQERVISSRRIALAFCCFRSSIYAYRIYSRMILMNRESVKELVDDWFSSCLSFLTRQKIQSFYFIPIIKVDRDLKTNNEKKKQTSSLIELDSLKTPQSRVWINCYRSLDFLICYLEWNWWNQRRMFHSVSVISIAHVTCVFS